MTTTPTANDNEQEEEEQARNQLVSILIEHSLHLPCQRCSEAMQKMFDKPSCHRRHPYGCELMRQYREIRNRHSLCCWCGKKINKTTNIACKQCQDIVIRNNPDYFKETKLTMDKKRTLVRKWMMTAMHTKPVDGIQPLYTNWVDNQGSERTEWENPLTDNNYADLQEPSPNWENLDIDIDWNDPLLNDLK